MSSFVNLFNYANLFFDLFFIGEMSFFAIDGKYLLESAQHGSIVILFLNALFFGGLILVCRNPIYSLLSLIVMFSSIVLVFLILNIEFLALTFLIIYIGAIAILFLFVIMMFNIKQMKHGIVSDELFYIVGLTYLLIPKMFIILLEYIDQYIFLRKYSLVMKETLQEDFLFDYEKLVYSFKYQTNDILILSDLLYTYYFYCFALIGVILLSAMLGSIVLALMSSEKED